MPLTRLSTNDQAAARTLNQLIDLLTGVMADPVNLLSANQSSIETDATGWDASGNCAIAQSSTFARDGTFSLRLTSIASGDMIVETHPNSGGTGAIPCQAGAQYTFTAWFRAAASGRSCAIRVYWYQANGANSAVTPNQVVVTGSDSVGAWTQVTGTVTSPSDAAFALVDLRVLATAAGGEIHYVDLIILAPGTPTILNDLVVKSVRASGVASLGSPRSTGRYVGQWTTAGAPTGLTSQIGDWGFDSNFAIWICSAAGTPGTWAAVGVSAQSQSTPADPAVLSASGMLGLAGSITPTASGKLLVIVSGNGSVGGGASPSGTFRIYYGTGAAPANAAAITGTAAGVAVTLHNGGGGGISQHFTSTQAIISGLTPGTAYWLDLGISAGGSASSAGFGNFTISAIEL